ncbi:MAG: hypothetical protein ACLFUV_00075 [Methanomassiliicoccales archaeon]
MDWGNLLRRMVHMCTPLFLLYYLAPDPLWSGGLSPQQGLVIVLAIVLGVEALRLIFKPAIPGMRWYEYHRVSAATWAGLGITLSLLFFPFRYTLPVFLGMGWVDPLIGELRKRGSGLYPWLPIVLYFLLAVGSMALVMGPSLQVLVAGGVATGLAIYVESLPTKIVDDDFLMLVVPLLGLAGTFWLFAQI